jgi:hypothetical protein
MLTTAPFAPVLVALSASVSPSVSLPRSPPLSPCPSFLPSSFSLSLPFSLSPSLPLDLALSPSVPPSLSLSLSLSQPAASCQDRQVRGVLRGRLDRVARGTSAAVATAGRSDSGGASDATAATAGNVGEPVRTRHGRGVDWRRRWWCGRRRWWRDWGSGRGGRVWRWPGGFVI